MSAPKVVRIHDFDEGRLFGIRRYAARTRPLDDDGFDVVDLFPRPAAARLSGRLGMLERLAMKQLVYPVELRGVRGDVFHVLDQSHAHLARIPDAPIVVTCHDLEAVRFGSPWRRRLARRRLSAIDRAALVVAVSETTATQVQRILGLPRRRIRVVRNRVSTFFRSPPTVEELAAARGLGGGLPASFALHVGASHEYKNIAGAIGALARIPGYPLVKVGAPLAPADRIRARHLHVPVYELGVVTDEALRALYHSATFLLYPSLDEGFCWPVAEALACGLPVVAAARGAIPEIAQDAYEPVDPTRPEAIARVLRRVLASRELRVDLRGRGIERGAFLASGSEREELVAVYRECLR